MATGDKKANFTLNRLLSRTDFATYFMSYLENLTKESFSAIFQGRSGILDVNTIGLAADGNDRFLLDTTSANQAMVTSGEILTVPSLVSGESREIYFENALGITYYVGLSYGEIPGDLDVNPRKGQPEYRTTQAVIGVVGNPDSLVDTYGVSLKVIVDTITEPGVSHAGRKARIWMVTPESSDPLVAFLDLDVSWDGSNNYVTVPYSVSSGPFGQNVSGSPPSTNAADYKVQIKGPRVSRGTDLSLDPTYAFIGTLVGVGSGSPPSSFNITQQVPVFLFDLDSAYDGIGSGAGNTINVDANGKPVLLKGFSGTFAVRPDLHHVFELQDFDDNTFFRAQSCGRLEDLPRFRDDFSYNSALWLSAATAPAALYVCGGVGAASDVKMKAANSNPDLGQRSNGVCEILCDGAASSSATIEGPAHRVADRLPAFYCRIAPERLTDQDCYIGLKLFGSLFPGFGFFIDDAALKGYSENITPTVTTTATLYTFTGDDLVDCYAVVYADGSSSTNYTIAFWVTGMTTPLTLDAPIDFSSPPAGMLEWYPAAVLTPKVGGVHADLTVWLDCWEVWSRENVIGA